MSKSSPYMRYSFIQAANRWLQKKKIFLISILVLKPLSLLFQLFFLKESKIHWISHWLRKGHNFAKSVCLVLIKQTLKIWNIATLPVDLLKILFARFLKLVLLEWSDSKSDCKFGISMLKPPCANFWSNWGNQWRLPACCKFRLMTHESDFERQPLL